MRYWIMTTEILPKFGGGIGTFVHELALGLHQAGHEVLILMPEWAQSKKITFVTHEAYTIAEFAPYSWSDQKQLGDIARLSHAFSNVFAHLVETHGEPDYIEAQDYLGIAYYTLARQRALEPGYPTTHLSVRAHCPTFVYSVYNDEPRYRFPLYWTGEMERFCFAAAWAILSPSTAADEMLTDNPSDPIWEKIYRAPNPFTLNAEKTPGNYDGGYVFFSRLQSIKGIIELCEAFQRRFDEGHTEALTIIGNSTLYNARNKDIREYLEQKHSDAVRKGLIHFLGHMPRDEAHRHIKNAKVIFVPSRFETFAYSIVESMSLERVVVAGKLGGQSDYMQDGINGFLFDHDEKGSIDQAIARAIDLSPEERQVIGARAAQSCQLFERDTVVADLLETLENHRQSTGETRIYPVVRPEAPVWKATQPATRDDVPGLLSVIVPFYNMGKYVNETLESIYQSNYRPLEVIVINDGSSCLESIEKLYQIEPPEQNTLSVQVVHMPNGGLSNARNVGAKYAKGEYLALLDPDDVVLPDYFSRAVRILDHYENVGFVGCWLQTFGEHDGGFIAWNPEPPYLLYHNTLNSAGIICRKQLFLDYGQNNPALFTGMEDYDAVVRMVAAGIAGVAIPEVLFRYRVRSDSMARQFNDDNQLLMYERIAESSPELYKKYAVELNGLLNANGPGWAFDNPSWNTHWRR